MQSLCKETGNIINIFYSNLTGHWGNLKMRIHRSKGLQSGRLGKFLHEYSYRHLYEKSGSIFQQLKIDLMVDIK